MLRRTAIVIATVVVTTLIPPSSVFAKAANTDERIKRLETIIAAQQKRIQAQELRLRRMERIRAASRRRVTRTKRRSTVQKRIIKDAGSGRFVAYEDAQKLELMRGGIMVPAVRIILPNGRSVLAPADQFKPLLVQGVKPKDPTFETVPEDKKAGEKKKTTPTRKRVVRRTVRRPAGRRVVVRRKKPVQTKTTDDSVRAKSEKQADQLLVNSGAILLRPGTLQIEPSFEYTRTSASNVAINGVSLFNAIVIGTIRVDSLDRDILSGSLRVRYGILSRLQFDATIPFIYRREVEVLGVGTPDIRERTVSGYGIGDIEMGLTGQPVIGSGWIPNILVRVGFKIPTGENAFEIPTTTIGAGGQTRLTRAPTGSGFYALSGTVTGVWSIDPVSLFVGGGYTYNMARSFGGNFGRINPGNTISFFSGINVALNEKVSLNLSFISQRTASTRQNSTVIANTSFTDSRVTLGSSIALSSNVSLIVNASMGLTRQSPDFVFSASLPISFNIR